MMKALVVLLGVLAGCQADTTKINDRLDKMDRKLDAIMAGGGGRPGAAAPGRPPPPAMIASSFLSILSRRSLIFVVSAWQPASTPSKTTRAFIIRLLQI